MNDSRLFQPLDIRSMRLKNRVVMLPMGSNFCGAGGEITDDLLRYYECRAQGGAGLIIIENACVDFPAASNGATQPRIDDNAFLPGLYKLTERLHRHGACVSIQLNHPGAASALRPVSASDIPLLPGAPAPRPLEAGELPAIAVRFADAAERARLAGFDAVEVHMGNGYLLNQFLSVYYNNREDDFGGSARARARFPRMVLDAVRERVGADFPVGVRMNVEEMHERANKAADTLEAFGYLDERIDCYNISAGLSHTKKFQIDTMDLPDGWKRAMARAVKERFGKPVIASGNIRRPETAEEILADGDADLIGLGRALIAEPQWPEKAARGREEEIRICISCNLGCSRHRVDYKAPLRCTVNPDILGEHDPEKHPVQERRNVVVIGGGTAGLMAACTAAERGCTVFLLEREAMAGGLAEQIARLPQKRRIRDFSDDLIRRAQRRENLFLLTDTEATLPVIARYKPHVVIHAAGARPQYPPVPGLHDALADGAVHTVFDLIRRPELFLDAKGKRVAVIGGGAVGLDVMEYFCELGAEITVVEMTGTFGGGLDYISWNAMENLMREHGVRMLPHTRLKAVAGGRFVLERDGGELELPFDYGFACMGMRAETGLWEELIQRYGGTGVELVNIGDSKYPRQMIDGAREGWEAAMRIEYQSPIK